MYKKIILIMLCFFLVGCSGKNINQMSLREIIDNTIDDKNDYININNKGYKYYLPSEFIVYEDKDYVQKLLSKNKIYYMYIDIVGYHYKNTDNTKQNINDYEYYKFDNKDKEGYLRITRKNDNFLVELCYNYAIIEVEVEESELRYAVSRSIAILNSIKYNDLVVGKIIAENNIENSETVYKIPQPENKDNNKNVLEYIEEFEIENTDDLD